MGKIRKFLRVCIFLRREEDWYEFFGCLILIGNFGRILWIVYFICDSRFLFCFRYGLVCIELFRVNVRVFLVWCGFKFFRISIGYRSIVLYFFFIRFKVIIFKEKMEKVKGIWCFCYYCVFISMDVCFYWCF